MEKRDVEDIEASLEDVSEWLIENENANKDELAEKMKNTEKLCIGIDSAKGASR